MSRLASSGHADILSYGDIYPTHGAPWVGYPWNLGTDVIHILGLTCWQRFASRSRFDSHHKSVAIMKSKTNPHFQPVPAGNPGSRPENHKRRKTHSHSVCGCLKDSWILEFLGFLIAAGALAAIVVLLRMYDGQLNPQLPVTLNVMVSLLGGVANAATLTGAKNSIA
jgi:hypothetical protein